MSAHGVDRSDWEREQPELDRRIVVTAARVLSVSMAFFFGGFFFAFVYLRLQNVNDHWNHIDAKPSMPWAFMILGATVLATVALLAVRGRAHAHEVARWRPGGLAALVLIAVAVVARVIQLWTLGQDPGAASFVSVFIGWSAALLVVEIGALYWIETLVARAGRLARADAADPDVAQADQRFPASATGFTLFWCVLTVIEVVAFVLLDLVR